MRRWTGDFTCIVLAWALVCIGAEAAFRVLGDRPTLDLQGLYSPFRDGLYKLRPNVDTEADWSSGHLTVHTDTLGLRCDDARQLATRPGETVDAIILGDSQGFGNGLSFDDTLAGATAEAAARDGFKMINASVGGHSAATQLVLAEWLRKQEGIKTSMYVLLATPAFVHGGGHLTRARVGADGRLYDVTASASAVARVWIKTHLVTYARLRDAARNAGIGADPKKSTPMVFSFYEAGAAEGQLERSFGNFLTRLSDFASTQGARVLVVYVPLTLEADFGPIRAAAATQGIAIDRDVPLHACMAAAQRIGVPLFNLRPVLEQRYQHGASLHLRADFHYDGETSRACAARLWPSLQAAISQTRHARSN